MFKPALVVAFALAMLSTIARADPVIAAHPRLLLTPAEKNRLMAKVNGGDVSWQTLRAVLSSPDERRRSRRAERDRQQDSLAGRRSAFHFLVVSGDFAASRRTALAIFRSSNRLIFPVAVFGSASIKRIDRGHL